MLGVTLFGIFLTPVFYYVIAQDRGTQETWRAVIVATWLTLTLAQSGKSPGNKLRPRAILDGYSLTLT